MPARWQCGAGASACRAGWRGGLARARCWAASSFWRAAARRPARHAQPARSRFTQITDLPGVESTPSLSPDGKTVAFVSRVDGDADIFVQRVGGHNPINLTPDCAKDDTGPAFSPDGERIAFRSECEGGGIFVMGATGESRRKVADVGHDPAWSPDGRSLAVASEPMLNPLSRRIQSEISVVDLASGASRRLLEQDAVQPAWSPDGRRIAFWGLRGGMGGSGARDIWTVAAAGGEAVEVTNDAHIDWNPAWSADGRLLYFASGRSGTLNLWRVPIDADDRPHDRLARARHDALPQERLVQPVSRGWTARLRGPGGALRRSTASPSTRSEAGWREHPSSSSEARALIDSLGLSPDGSGWPSPAAGLRENIFRGAAGRHGLPPDHRRRVPQPRPQLVARTGA